MGAGEGRGVTLRSQHVMSQPAPSLLQQLVLGEELSTSVRLIQAGLGQLQRIDAANDFWHLPLLTLAQGFERLLKAIICFEVRGREGHYPRASEPSFSGSKGHDLEGLLERVAADCFNSGYLTAPAARADLELIRNDQSLRALLRLLSDFGRSSRYYNYDLLLGKADALDPSPEQVAEQLEMQVLGEIDPDWLEKLPAADLNQMLGQVTTHLVGRLEGLARALVRLLTLGPLADEGLQYAAYVQSFLNLTDEQLGATRYDGWGG